MLRAAANTLANISIDHFYQQSFLKDPEKSILLKMILNTKDINILKSLVVVFTNICTNTNLISELVHSDVLDTIFLLFERDYPQLRGYLSRILAQISIVSECRT